MEIGDKVKPISIGLWLADCPVNGEYKQKRNNVCVFYGVGTILDKHECVIDYDMWDTLSEENPHHYYDIGKVDFADYLIECDNGIGWGSAVVLVEDKST